VRSSTVSLSGGSDDIYQIDDYPAAAGNPGVTETLYCSLRKSAT
jgi:hypothetical protein